MKSSKMLSISIAIISCVTIVTLGAYAYFVATQKHTNDFVISTGNIQLCFPDFYAKIVNILPGETGKNLNAGKLETITNMSNREMKVELSFEGRLAGFLPKGEVPDAKYIGVDYVYNDYEGMYQFTDKRIYEVLRPFMTDELVTSSVTQRSSFTQDPATGRFYAIAKPQGVDGSILRLGSICVDVLPALGGKTDVDPRPYEMASSFYIGMRIAAVPADYTGSRTYSVTTRSLTTPSMTTEYFLLDADGFLTFQKAD